MWVGLDTDKRNIATSVGSGIVTQFKRVATYPIETLLSAVPEQPEASADEVAARDPPDQEERPSTIAEVMAPGLAIQVMTGLADELDDRLHGEFGGKRFFVEGDKPGGRSPSGEERIGQYL